MSTSAATCLNGMTSLPSVGKRVSCVRRFSACAPLVARRVPKCLHIARATPDSSDPLLLQACPVPKEQQPMNEFRELQNAFLFDWAGLPWPQLTLRLIGLFGGFFVFLGLPISAVTFSVEDELLQVLAASTIGSGFITTVLLLRLYLGYSHVGNRLLSATIEYEETGWYDGQVWVKSPQMLMRDRLMGTYQVKPLLDKLKRALIGVSGAVAAATVLLVTAPPPKAYSSSGSAYDLDGSMNTFQAKPTTMFNQTGSDYWQSVQEYEPWAMEESEEAPSSSSRPSILDHMRSSGM